MENVRSFKLKNNGDFVARIQVLKLLGDKWHNVAPTSGYRDICKHAERTFDLQGITGLSAGEKVKLKAEVVLGKDKTATEEFLYDPAGLAVAYEISGTTLSNKLKRK